MIATKQITVPSGGGCMCRAMTARDWWAHGSIPEIADIDGKEPSDVKPAKPNHGFIVAAFEIALTRCCGEIRWPDGRKARIVKQPFDAPVKPGQLPIDLLDQADADVIYQTVCELSAMGKEAAERGPGFPEKPEAQGEPRPGGSTLPSAAV